MSQYHHPQSSQQLINSCQAQNYIPLVGNNVMELNSNKNQVGYEHTVFLPNHDTATTPAATTATNTTNTNAIIHPPLTAASHSLTKIPCSNTPHHHHHHHQQGSKEQMAQWILAPQKQQQNLNLESSAAMISQSQQSQYQLANNPYSIMNINNNNNNSNSNSSAAVIFEPIINKNLRINASQQPQIYLSLPPPPPTQTSAISSSIDPQLGCQDIQSKIVNTNRDMLYNGQISSSLAGTSPSDYFQYQPQYMINQTNALLNDSKQIQARFSNIESMMSQQQQQELQLLKQIQSSMGAVVNKTHLFGRQFSSSSSSNPYAIHNQQQSNNNSFLTLPAANQPQQFYLRQQSNQLLNVESNGKSGGVNEAFNRPQPKQFKPQTSFDFVRMQSTDSVNKLTRQLTRLDSFNHPLINNYQKANSLLNQPSQQAEPATIRNLTNNQFPSNSFIRQQPSSSIENDIQNSITNRNLFNHQQDSCKKIGKLTIQERNKRLEKFRQKRSKRKWKKTVEYQCRKLVADRRPRVRGRFVSKIEAEQIVKTQNVNKAQEQLLQVRKRKYINGRISNRMNFSLQLNRRLFDKFQKLFGDFYPVFIQKPMFKIKRERKHRHQSNLDGQQHQKKKNNFAGEEEERLKFAKVKNYTCIYQDQLMMAMMDEENVKKEQFEEQQLSQQEVDDNDDDDVDVADDENIEVGQD